MTDPADETRLLPSPREMIAYLDRFVYGQEQAKRDLATAAYNHYLDLAVQDRQPDHRVASSAQHVLLMGPTGTGKTYMVKVLARFLDVPFAFVSATSLVKTGYVGTTVEAMVRNLVAKVDGDVYKAERGIIFVDEFDKIRSSGRAAGPDVSGEGVQIGMLTLLDGRRVSLGEVRSEDVESQKTPGEIDTSRVLFICGGAFVGLDEIIRSRSGVREIAGFTDGGPDADGPESNGLAELEVADLVQYGLIPELLGRFATFSTVSLLSRDDLVHILNDTEESVLLRKTAFWRLHGIELEFTPGALLAISDRALELGTGARGLHRIVEEALNEIDWRPMELVEDGVRKIKVTEDVVREGQPLLLEKGEPREDLSDLPVTGLREIALDPRPPEPRLEEVNSESRDDSPEQVRRRLELLKVTTLDWSGARDSARSWWKRIEHANRDRPHVVLQLAEELDQRSATLQEFYVACNKSMTDNLQASLHYLDYIRLRELDRE